MITIIKIDNTDVFLEDMGPGKGKITISDTYDHNFSYFWGSMGGDLKQFITSINKEYFASKLMGCRKDNEMDVKRTFTNIRKHIANELYLPYYKHMEFQKDMREKLKEFQQETEDYPSQDLFITKFYQGFINRLAFFLIDGRYERESIEKDFKSISEPWHFIDERPGKQYVWIEKFHAKLVSALKKDAMKTEP